MPVFDRLETNDTTFQSQSRNNIWLHSFAHNLGTFLLFYTYFFHLEWKPGSFCANHPEFLPVDPDLQQCQSDFQQLCGEMWLVGTNSSAMGLCWQANAHHCVSYKAFNAV